MLVFAWSFFILFLICVHLKILNSVSHSMELGLAAVIYSDNLPLTVMLKVS